MYYDYGSPHKDRIAGMCACVFVCQGDRRPDVISRLGRDYFLNLSPFTSDAWPVPTQPY